MFDIQGSLLPVVIVALAAAFAVYTIVIQREGKNAKLPPGPRGWPIIGSLGLMGGHSHRIFARLADQYGPLMSIRLGSVLTVIASSPDMAREILQTHDQKFAFRPSTVCFDVMSYGGKDMVMAQYGPYWRFVKKLTTTELFSAERVNKFQNIRKELILETLSTIHKRSEGMKGIRIDVILLELAANNITQMLIKKSLYGLKADASKSDVTREFIAVVKEMLYLGTMAVPNLGDFIPFLKPFDLQGLKARSVKVMARFDKVIELILDDHILEKGRISNAKDSTNTEVPSLVQIMSSMDSLKSDDGKDLDHRILMKGLIENMLLGGTDTTGNSVYWTMSALMKNPEIMEIVQKELDEVVGSDRIVEETDIPQLLNLQAVVKETFRLYPVAPLIVPHRNAEECIVAGFRIPANSMVMVNTWAMGRDPKIWENPLEFNPSRFLNSPVNLRGQHFQLIPFGAGRRMCPASNLAITLAHSTLAHLLHAFKWSLTPDQSPDDLDLTESSDGTTLASPIGFCASLRYPAGPYSSLLDSDSPQQLTP